MDLDPVETVCLLPQREGTQWRLMIRLNNILVKHTGQEFEVIEKDTDRDIYFNPADAVSYGLIDTILETDSAGDNNK